MGILFNARDYAVIDHLVWQGRKKRIFDRLKADTVQRVASFLATKDLPPKEIRETHVEIVPRTNQHQPTVWSMRSSVARRGGVWEITVEYFGPYDRTPFAEISIGSLLHSPKLLQEFYVTSWRGKTFHIEPVPGWDDSTPTNRHGTFAGAWYRHSLPLIVFSNAPSGIRRKQYSLSVYTQSIRYFPHLAREAKTLVAATAGPSIISDIKVFVSARTSTLELLSPNYFSAFLSETYNPPVAQTIPSAMATAKLKIKTLDSWCLARRSDTEPDFASHSTPRTRQRTPGDPPRHIL